MDGLIEGRIVHFVMPNMRHRAAIVANIVDKYKGVCDLFVLGMPDDGMGGFMMNLGTEFDEHKKPLTWHWIERAE